MRSFIIASAFLAALVSAQAAPRLPSCASSCVSSDFGGCGSLNVNCICSNKPLIANLACCVSKACNQADQEATISFANSLCQGNGVSDLPQSATCAPGASSTAASGSSSATGSVTSSLSSAIAAASSSVASTNGTAASTTATSSGASTASGSTASGSASGTSSGSATSATTTASGSASNRIEVAALGLGALVFGALAGM